MNKKICTKCNEEKLESDFFFRDKKLNTRRGDCKSCSTNRFKSYYLLNKRKHQQRCKEFRLKSREFVNGYLKERNCKDCGNSDIRVLEFDHLRDKKKDISTMLNGSSIATIKAEIEKCEVVCANCHRIRTSISQQWNKI